MGQPTPFKVRHLCATSNQSNSRNQAPPKHFRFIVGTEFQPIASPTLSTRSDVISQSFYNFVLHYVQTPHLIAKVGN
ncbi:MAG: hypothetical protein NC187_08010, partial [Candidatus Amulumruptor caecigallinarius]|nr:hypothetical protein [Candidatus Amulumruptor caecigallinarius]MCM1397414.1 hypothetical protein [Candidatus Amulumruptor caecigallinarius]MCM1454379.1 hypothetical protein [bacterium]